MKRLILVVLALTMVAASVGSAEAAGNGRRGQAGFQRGNGGGLISKMIELERRKNAALRRIFLGG